MTSSNLTLADYVRRRNGVPLGGSGALRAMLTRSLGAPTIVGFWQYWNPIFGYYLGKFIFRPARSVGLPVWLATLLTFSVSGMVHDIAASLITRQLVLVCTPWFLFLGIGLLISRGLGMDMKSWPWVMRAGVHITYIGVCARLALLLKHQLAA